MALVDNADTLFHLQISIIKDLTEEMFGQQGDS